jgi:hypothetical protein
LNAFLPLNVEANLTTDGHGFFSREFKYAENPKGTKSISPVLTAAATPGDRPTK